jgi:hypothetical protein
VNSKYQPSPNLLCFHDRGSSPFWKGVLWTAKAAKMGYKWHIGDGQNIRFWEDQWFGSCSLAIEYWELYSISNEKIFPLKRCGMGAT